jgi:nucleotide-binding universal stress UspA family protein
MVSTKIERGLVVVGVDGSEQSVSALHWAARYAAATGAAVRAVLAWHYPAAAGQAPTGLAPHAVREETERSRQDTLEHAIGQAFPGGAGVEARVSYGHPAQVLIEESKEADLLVVGSHGHGAFTGMLVGSVSIHCVTSAYCPVTVVRGTVAAAEAGTAR